MFRKLLPLLFTLASVPSARAQEITNIPELGRHQRILILEKSVNRQNTIGVYTRVDAQCRFQTSPKKRDEPVFGFYWLDDGTRFEAFSSFYQQLIGSRFVMTPGKGARRNDTFYVTVSDLASVANDLPSKTIEVRAVRTPKGCDVSAFMTLGKSNRNAHLRVDDIYVEASGLGGPDAITISGRDLSTGAKISRRFVKNDR